MSDKRQLPILPLRGINIFPKTVMHFDVQRTKSIQALEFAMKHEQIIFFCAQKEAYMEKPSKQEDLFTYGTIGRIKQLIHLPNKVVRILAEGLTRGQLIQLVDQTTYLEGEVVEIESVPLNKTALELKTLRGMVFEVIETFKALNTNLSKTIFESLRQQKDMGELMDAVGSNLLSILDNRQKVLEKNNVEERITMTLSTLNMEIEMIRIKNNVNRKVKKKLDKNQRDYYLREQIKVIQEELGDEKENEDEASEYTKKMEALEASQIVKDRISKEIKRLRRISASSSESAVVRNYIESLLELPWNKKTEDNTDTEKAQKTLDEDHYGLEKVKERIIEHLAVRKMAGKTDSPIICLVGPPGTGKTSIAKSVARAVNRKYARISLGGIRDEAEIRGHRKTYIGAMPGRIIHALKQAGSGNPLILLDEMDKMSSDMRGNPAAALLEVLDGEQNNKFRDHYIEMDVDLSDVLFIGTANTLRTIPRALMDRLEIIQVSSYTANEKIHIAKSYLMKKQLVKHGLKQSQLKISDGAIGEIINSYTKESGVRHLERRIGQICRKVIKEIVEKKRKTAKLSEKNVKKYLGIPSFSYDKHCEEPQVGVVRGLAWTEVGGDTLSIEVNVMPGTGKFKVTGQIGSVMQESADAAISYARTITKEYGIEELFYRTKDIHIHIPQGAVPKDGPSAGITMATAIISALTNKKINNKVAMTGEITLRGRVLPIGGLKEKLLAAKRAGIEKVLVPIDNKRNVGEISQEITENLEIKYMRNMLEVLKEAFI